MKILVIGDLHGQKPKIHFKDFDCIAQVGDVCDDSKIEPLYKKYFNILKKNPLFDMDVDKFFIKEVGKSKLRRYEKESLKEGRKLLEFLNSFGKPVFFVPGNWDQSYGSSKIKNLDKSDYNYLKAFYDWYLGDKINIKLIKDLKNIQNCMYKTHLFSEINFLGYGLNSGPEKISKKGKLNLSKFQKESLKKAYNKIRNKLEIAYKKRNKKFPTIFLSHNIPHNTKLDVILKKDSPRYKRHAGSHIARKFCEKYQPLICVGGHIHEHFGKDKIGKTIVINAGFGKDAQVLIDIDEKKGKIRKIDFFKGYKKHKH